MIGSGQHRQHKTDPAIVAVAHQLHDPPQHGLFTVTFNNSKVRMRGKSEVRYDASGYCFERTGHVFVDSNDLQVRDFGSMSQLRDYLDAFGVYRIVWNQREEEE